MQRNCRRYYKPSVSPTPSIPYPVIRSPAVSERPVASRSVYPRFHRQSPQILPACLFPAGLLLSARRLSHFDCVPQKPDSTVPLLFHSPVPYILRHSRLMQAHTREPRSKAIFSFFSPLLFPVFPYLRMVSHGRFFSVSNDRCFYDLGIQENLLFPVLRRQIL